MAKFLGAGAAVGSLGSVATREKTGKRDGDGGVCARASVATVNARPAGKLFKSSKRCLALTNASV
eukprot:1834757-Pleurochrysis_carterae.AAC.1